jgi:hypothetical protein
MKTSSAHQLIHPYLVSQLLQLKHFVLHGYHEEDLLESCQSMNPLYRKIYLPVEVVVLRNVPSSICPTSFAGLGDPSSSSSESCMIRLIVPARS